MSYSANNTNSSLNVLQNEGTEKKSHLELLTIKNFLFTACASRAMIEKATGITIQNLCWHVGKLKELGLVVIAMKEKCKITNRKVQYLTSDPEKFPFNNQLTLF